MADFRDDCERVLAWTTEQQKNPPPKTPHVGDLPLIAAILAATVPRPPIIEQIARVRAEG